MTPSEFVGELCSGWRICREGAVKMCEIKPGDTVYQVDACRMYESKIKSLIYDTDGVAFDGRAIGKAVFLTRAEAEAALKGGA